MNHLMVFAIALLAQIPGLPSAGAQSETGQASAYYREGKFKASAAEWQDLLKTRPDDPYINYNLGNAYFKQNKTGYAIASYSRAFKLLPRDPDIRYNLSFCLKRTGQDLAPAGVPSGVYILYYWFSSKELAGLTWLFVWLCLITGSASIFAYRLRRLLSLPLLICSGALVVFGAWLAARSLTELPNAGVIVEPAASVRSGPGDNFETAASVPEGHIIEILDAKDDWIELGLRKEGIKGWVKSSAVERI